MVVGAAAMLTRWNHEKYHHAMTTTIDRAGRIVVPKSLRERFNLVAGTELEIEVSGECLQLRKVGAEPALVRKKGILVHHGGGLANLARPSTWRSTRPSPWIAS